MSSTKTASNKTLAYVIDGAVLIVALLLFWALRVGVYESAIIISGSMSPTLEVGDRLLVDHRDSWHGKWRRGDIVTFTPPPSWAAANSEGEQYVKRIIGLPGETVEVNAGQTTIDGKPLAEPYLTLAPSPVETPVSFTLGADQYFVMGDNRPNSEDARDHGPISDSDIHGRAVRILGPWNHMGAVRSPDYDRNP